MPVNLLQWFVFVLGIGVLVVFGVIAVSSLLGLLCLVLRGWFGQRIRYVEGSLPPEILKAVEPIGTKRTKAEASPDTSTSQLMMEIHAAMAANNRLIEHYLLLLEKQLKKEEG